jgi:hypothetical protein
VIASKLTDESYYLVENRNGFEEPLRAGTKEELESLKTAIEKTEWSSSQGGNGKQAWERRSYYIVTKTEWDREHCPLVPVDLS